MRLGSWIEIAIYKLLPLHIWRVLARSPHPFLAKIVRQFDEWDGLVWLSRNPSDVCPLTGLPQEFLKGPVVECWNWPGGFGRSGGTLFQNGEEE